MFLFFLIDHSGLDNAGKSTLINEWPIIKPQLAIEELKKDPVTDINTVIIRGYERKQMIAPTLGYSIHYIPDYKPFTKHKALNNDDTVASNNLRFFPKRGEKRTQVTIWDIGGQPSIRPFWSNYYRRPFDHILWVMDGSSWFLPSTHKNTSLSTTSLSFLALSNDETVDANANYLVVAEEQLGSLRHLQGMLEDLLEMDPNLLLEALQQKVIIVINKMDLVKDAKVRRAIVKCVHEAVGGQMRVLATSSYFPLTSSINHDGKVSSSESTLLSFIDNDMNALNLNEDAWLSPIELLDTILINGSPC